MNLVSNTKTIIFDDDPKEIKNLRDALDKLLIQSIYVNFGEPTLIEREESEKLTNVRFIFADILLGTKKESDSAIAVEPVISSIINNVSKDNGIFILILWSKDIVEHKTELTRALREDENYKFIEMTNIEKNDYIEKDGNPPVQTIDNLIEIIKEKLKDEEYFTLLREWESDTQKSTSQVFNLFFDTEDRTKDYINGAIKSIISGKEKPTILDKKKALWASMNTIMSDTIEKSIGSDEGTNQLNNDVLENLDLKILDNNNISSLNSKLLFEIPTSDNVNLYPGNIFCFTSYLSLCDKLKEKVCGYEDYSNYFGDDVFSYSKNNTDMTKNNGEDAIVFQTRVKDKLLKTIKPILLEFTPYCDYSNGKIKKSRLIFGYLVPSDNQCIKNAEYLYKSSFSFVYNEVSYILVLSLRHIFGVNPEVLNDFTLLFRARKELVNDIQHNIAHHISRVGVSSL